MLPFWASHKDLASRNVFSSAGTRGHVRIFSFFFLLFFTKCFFLSTLGQGHHGVAFDLLAPRSSARFMRANLHPFFLNHSLSLSLSLSLPPPRVSNKVSLKHDIGTTASLRFSPGPRAYIVPRYLGTLVSGTISASRQARSWMGTQVKKRWIERIYGVGL